MSETTTAVVEAPAAPPAEPESGGDTTVVVAVEEAPPAEPESGGDTTVVVVEEPAADEGAQDDATQLDHEQRITRLEEQVGQVRGELAEKITWEQASSMIPSHSETVDTAAAVAAEVATEVVADIAEDGDVDGGTVRVEEPDGSVDVVSVDPGAPAVNDTGRRRSGLFKW